MSRDTWYALGIGLTLITIVVVYFLFLFEAWKKKKFVFSPYQPPPAPSNAFYPGGQTTPLTPDQIQQRQSLLACLQQNGIDKFDSVCLGGS